MTTKGNRARKIGAALAVTALAVTACGSGGSEDSAAGGGDILFYDTSGGDVWTQLDATLFADYTAASGVTVTDDYNEAATKFFGAAEAGQVPWSLVFFP